MTNTEDAPFHSIEIARALVQAGEAIAAERKVEHDAVGWRDWGSAELAVEFSAHLGSVLLWCSADGREVHCSAHLSEHGAWSGTPSAILDAACDRVDFTWHPQQRIEEVAPGHDVLLLW